MKYKIVILFCIFFCCKIPAKELTIGVPEWQGYTNADGSGIYFDLIRSTFPDDSFNIKIDSYNRTLANFHKNKLDIVVGVFREDIQQGIFPHWFLDTEAPTTAFYDPQQTQLTHLSDLEDLTVSWLRGYKFNNFIPYVTSPYLVNTLATGFELVAKNRVNVFIDYPYNVPEKYQQKLSQLEVVPSRHVYLVFKNDSSGQQLANQYDKMMLTLRDSGALADIFTEGYEESQLSKFEPNKEKIIIETSVTKKTSRSVIEPIESKVLDLLIDKNEDFNIELKIATQSSSNNEKEKNICYSNKLKTKTRSDKYIFSKPMTFYMGLRLYSKHQLHGSEPVELAKLVKNNPNKKLSVIKGRSYTDSIDEQLLALLPTEVNFLQSDIDTYLNEFSEGDIDFIIEYPSAISNSKIGTNAEKLFSYPIKGANDYNLGHIMCKETPANKLFIQSINGTLMPLYSTEYFINIFYLEVDDNSKNDFYRYYSEAFTTK